MDEHTQTELKHKNILLIIGVVTSILAGSVAWLGYQVNTLSKKVDSQTTDNSAKDSTPEQAVTYKTIESGMGAFTINVPSGWGPLIKTTKDDTFYIGSMTQPTVAGGAETKIIEMEALGGDGPSLFVAMLSDEGTGDPLRGVAEDFELGKTGIVGKKYSYIYPKDDVIGIGTLRTQNDRDYHYVFTTPGGKKLDILYHVYGSDPRNQVAVVDDIVRSIVIE